MAILWRYSFVVTVRWLKMSSPPDPASHQRGEHLLHSAGQLLRDVTTVSSARSLSRVEVELVCLIGRWHFPQAGSRLPTWAGRRTLLRDVTRVPKEVGEEAKVQDTSPLVEVEVEKYTVGLLRYFVDFEVVESSGVLWYFVD